MGQEPPVGQSLLIVEASLWLTVRHTTVSRTPLDKWSARRRDPLPVNTEYSHETDIYAPRRDSKPQSQQARACRPHALDRAATGISYHLWLHRKYSCVWLWFLLVTERHIWWWHLLKKIQNFLQRHIICTRGLRIRKGYRKTQNVLQ